MGLLNARLFLMNNLKIETPKSGGRLALFEKDKLPMSESVSECVNEKAKLIRGDPPPQNCVKKKWEPPKISKIS
jgi:hypothetical protein